MWLIFGKEIRELFYSPRYILIFITATALIVGSLVNGYLMYSEEMEYIAQKKADNLQNLQSNINTGSIRHTICREPSLMFIFDFHASNLVGRQSWVRASKAESRGNIYSFVIEPHVTDSIYDQNPILAFFGDLNLTFVVTVILPLFAIMLSFNAISGEKELGTLRQIFSNSIRRSTVFLAKFMGGYIPLALTFIIPFLIGLLGITLFTSVVFSVEH
ncbi:MAG: ABC transporter permease, partial [Chlorobiales bacterium]|nr:ABC transporter permease [Chlorobiales bacterium]